MRLSHLQTLNYRNLEDATLDFSPGLNLVSGPNGQGKTNLLEAIYLVLTGFTDAGRLEQLVRFGQKEAYVKATLERELAGQEITDIDVDAVDGTVFFAAEVRVPDARNRVVRIDLDGKLLPAR